MLVRNLKKFNEIFHGSALRLKYNASFFIDPNPNPWKRVAKTLLLLDLRFPSVVAIFDVSFASLSQVFVKAGAALDLNQVQPKPCKLILDMTWLNLVELSSKLREFRDLLNQV